MKSDKITLTGYVQIDGMLYTYETNEGIRRATAAEKRESFAEGDTGAIGVEVCKRTLKNNCPRYVAMMRTMGVRGW